MELEVWEAFSAPERGLGHRPRSQRIQRYLPPKTRLKWQCQRQLASAHFAEYLWLLLT